ncbi:MULTISPECIES: MbtH family protein [Frankia]|uniref:MbtH family protein n=1 Tax=Frankia TaxID=1854 RepID=UPI000460F1B1|nr:MULTISPECIES: MbtH family protein [Frankia]KDA42834.1 hypothetical protein BMG523Draft_02384 [Frankia sp. BMG5.23]KEZ34494.1 hypothetical protein CEDDRAFT_04156 [Frankia sp. CeD]ORT92173.1 antibiotic synthesis protein MbtH [Frankia casuarinae]ORT92732.1 antibiotic synthesis protein MbtH [Frankia casuarinae]
MSGFLSDDETYPCRVVVNDEEQYSLWPLDRDVPDGWRDGGFQGPRRDCLAYIDETWVDMRPKSVRTS